MIRLALPALAEQLLGVMVMLVDVWLTGRFLKDAPELAAIGLMAYVMWFLTAMFDFVCVGATALTARHVGGGDYGRATHVANQAVLVGGALAVAATFAVTWVAPAFVTLMQLQGEAAALAVRYIRIVVTVLPAIMVQRVGIACLRGAGDMATVFWLMAVINLVNVAVSAALVIGVGPVPKLGWDGLAIGTATAHLVGGFLLLVMLARGYRGLRLRIPLLRPNRKLIRSLLRIGIPGGTDTMFVITCHMWYLSIINNLGNADAAAHNVAVRLESLAFLPGTAFAMAAATLAGQFLGARDYDRAGRSVLLAALSGCGVMLIPAVFFLTVGQSLASIFLDPSQTAVAEQAAELLWIASFFMIPLGLVMILSGALRGAGDTRWPLAIGIIGMLGVRIPCAYWLTGVLGVTGAWYATGIDLVIRCLLVSYRFRHGGWKNIKV